jgi:hypothetical protein
MPGNVGIVDVGIAVAVPDAGMVKPAGGPVAPAGRVKPGGGPVNDIAAGAKLGGSADRARGAVASWWREGL